MSFGHCTKGCCKAGSLSDPWVLPFWSHARLSRWGCNWQFPRPFLGQHPYSRGAWPKGNGHPQQIILQYVWAVDQAGGQAGKMVHWPLHSPSHTGAGTRHVVLQQGQMNDPEWARGVQPCLSWPICKWVGMTLNLDKVIQGWAESHRPWSRN